MALSKVDDSATISTTEYSLPSDSTTRVAQTDDCILQPWIDFGAMTYGDAYEIKGYEKVNGGTQGVVWTAKLEGPQSRAFVGPSMMVGEGWDVTVKRTAGSDRSIGWSLRKNPATISFSGGSETVSTTEHSMLTDSSTMTDDTSDKLVQILLDVSAISAVADDFEFRLKEKINAGTQRDVIYQPFCGKQTTIYCSPAMMLMDSWQATLKKIAGTDRSIAWSIRTVT